VHPPKHAKIPSEDFRSGSSLALFAFGENPCPLGRQRVSAGAHLALIFPSSCDTKAYLFKKLNTIQSKKDSLKIRINVIGNSGRGEDGIGPALEARIRKAKPSLSLTSKSLRPCLPSSRNSTVDLIEGSLSFCVDEIGVMVEATHRGFSRSKSFSRGAGPERGRPAKMFEHPGPRPLDQLRDASSEPPRKRRGNGVKNPSGSPGHDLDLIFSIQNGRGPY